ncbi:MAG: hypothetical protein PSV22_15040 [Pseudolabrys sp.]|nr:hypothetical protein [Pseudolabrys sp.]
MAAKSEHLVVCEDEDDLSQVIAANYAFAMRAGLHLVPSSARDKADEILEQFYNVYEQRRAAPTEILDELKSALRKRCSEIPIPANGSITFITGGMPYGFGFPELPSTHLFNHPDLGLAALNGFIAEQPKTRGVSVAVLVDPSTTKAPDIQAAVKALPSRGIFARVYEGSNATVRNVTDMVELFPYDLLIFATHCGDVSGYQWTYEFKDSEGIDRTFVVDIAIGLAASGDPGRIGVTQFMSFASLDGVDWRDPTEKAKLYVGKAVLDFMAKTRSNLKDELKPIKKEDIERVRGSAALKMYDHNFISLPKSIADHGSPIIINNACASWHRLASNYMYGNARAYIGTLFPVTEAEASEVFAKLMDKHYGKPLAGAVWSSQREVYGDSVRRPYVVTGIYPQSLRSVRHNVPGYISRRLDHALSQWKSFASSGLANNDPENMRQINEIVDYYARELEAFVKRWRSEIK